jgi:antitoxin (DNA-binding transcriptional repressor) of toxin-antitoxin stability system
VKFISVQELERGSDEVWSRLEKERLEVVVTSAGRPIALLTSVSEDTLEESLSAVRRARATSAVAELQRQSLEQGLDRLTAEEIDAEIAAVRRERRKSQEPQ